MQINRLMNKFQLNKYKSKKRKVNRLKHFLFVKTLSLILEIIFISLNCASCKQLFYIKLYRKIQSNRMKENATFCLFITMTIARLLNFFSLIRR